METHKIIGDKILSTEVKGGYYYGYGAYPLGVFKTTTVTEIDRLMKDASLPTDDNVVE